MSTAPIPVAKFRLGRLVATPGALTSIPNPEILIAIARHQAGDWGEVPEEDSTANDQALVEGGRLLSAYQSPIGVRFWIITEADRRITTILLPEEY